MAVEDAQLYHDLMRLKPDGWTANAWAVRAGVSRTVWTDMRRHGNPSRRTLEKLLDAAGSSLAEFEALRISEAPIADADRALGVGDRTAGWRQGHLPPLPLIASAEAGQWQAGEVHVALIQLDAAAILQQLPRPVSLDGDPAAYAFALTANAMWPRFRLGRNLAISPAAAVTDGDDVLITISRDQKGLARAFVAELSGRNAERIELRQFDPPATFSIAQGDVVAIHKIVGELI